MSKWGDGDEPGTISTLQTMLKLSTAERQIIKRVLVYTNICIEAGIAYSGEILWDRGHPTCLVQANSTEETIIANYVERGCSVSLTTIVVNVHRYKKGSTPIGRSAVYNAMKRMVSRKAPVVKRCQGNVDKNSNWAKANKAQKGQLLLRAGCDVNLDCFKDEDGNLPKGYDMAHMTPIYKEGVVYWDEAHQYCRTTELGDLQSSNTQFPRDEHGNYDPNGTYIGIPSINKWINEAKAHIIDGDAPVGICYLDYENPYAAKYGEDNWKAEIDASPAMSGYVNVRKLVKHIVDVSMDIYAGATMEGKWFFYHDALKQMCAADTIKWMEEEDYLKWWIRPEHGICSAYSHYKVHYVGNQAEAMPLDNSLFADALQALDRMVVLSHALCDNKEDERLFSMTTPKLGSRALDRIFDPIHGVAPTPDRIVEDIEGVWKNMMIIYKNDGAHVPNLCNRTGHRKEAGRTGKGKWGGPREKGVNLLLGNDEEEGPWADGGIGDIHKDVKDLFKEHDMLKASSKFFEIKMERKRELEGDDGDNENV